MKPPPRAVAVGLATLLGAAPWLAAGALAADDPRLYAAAIAAADANLRLHDTQAAQRWLAEAPAALRGFEWRYLHGCADESLESTDTGEPVSDLAVSPDGTLVATTGRNGSVKLWDGETLKPLRSMAGHAAAAWGVAFSPDGRVVASGSSDGTVRLWDAGSGTAVRTLSPTGRGITAVAFHPDGSRLATTSWDRTAERGVGAGAWELPGYGLASARTRAARAASGSPESPFRRRSVSSTFAGRLSSVAAGIRPAAR